MELLARTSFPALVNFDISPTCNAHCSFCYIADRSNENSHPFNVDVATRVIAILSDAGVLRLNFAGGEPTILPQLPHLLKCASACNMRLSLITNGLLLSPDLLDKISPYLDVLSVSIHGLGHRHDQIIGVQDAFARVSHSLQLLSSREVPFGINYTVTEGSSHDFLSTAGYILDRYPVKYFSLNRCIGGQNSKEKGLLPTIKTLNCILDQLEILAAKYNECAFSFAIFFPLCLVEKPSLRRFIKTCGMGNNYCSVDYTGNVRLCSYANNTLGNILQNSPDEIWERNPILEGYSMGSWLPPACKQCDLMRSCLSGCRVSDSTLYYGPDALLAENEPKPIIENWR
jgi:radical SAM protein with 4Fe4S-binding SPASM domain